MAKLSTIQDNFDDNSLSLTWGTDYSGGAVSEVGQEILITVSPNTAGSYAYIYTSDYYDASNESNFINLAGAAAGSCDTLFLYVNNIDDRFGFIWNNSSIISYINVGGIEEYRESAAISPSTNTYLRIRHSGNTVYWDYSTSGVLNWTTLSYATQPFDLTVVKMLLGVYEWGSSATPGSTRFDNFNYTTLSYVSVSVSSNILIQELFQGYSGDAASIFVPGIENITITDVVTVAVEVVQTEIGMNVFSTSDNLWYAPDEVFDAHVQACLDNGITKIRVEIGSYGYEEPLQHSKDAVVRAKALGAYVIWGVSGDDITAANWPDQRVAIISAAEWAHYNGVDEFVIGNEEEYKVDGTTITVSQVQANLKSVATEVQTIFTNGPVSYNTSKDFLYDWISIGKGDIDTFGLNLYLGGQYGYDDTWMDAIDDAIAEWGDEAFLSEFGPSYTNLSDYSTNETTQAAGVQTMMDYCSSAGMKTIYYFSYYDDPRPFGVVDFGALKTTGIYRLLWYNLIRFKTTLSVSVIDLIVLSNNVAITTTLSEEEIKPIDFLYILEYVSVVIGQPFAQTFQITVSDTVATSELIRFGSNFLYINVITRIRVYEYDLSYIKFIPRSSKKTQRKTLFSGSLKNELQQGTKPNQHAYQSWGGSI